MNALPVALRAKNHQECSTLLKHPRLTSRAVVCCGVSCRNVDGKVTWSEFHRVVKFDQDFKDETTQEQKEDFRDIDTNGDNHISKEEMVSLCLVQIRMRHRWAWRNGMGRC